MAEGNTLTTHREILCFFFLVCVCVCLNWTLLKFLLITGRGLPNLVEAAQVSTFFFFTY